MLRRDARAATSSSTTRTTRSRPRSSASSSRRSRTPTSSRSSMTVYRTSDDSPLVPALIRADRARQAGGLPRGAQGALRRAREHRLGARAGGGGRPRRLRPARRSRPTPSACSSCAARATACATTSTSGPATTTRRPRACTPTSGCSRATSRSAPTSPTCSTSSPASRARGATARCCVAPDSLRDGDHRRDRAHDRRHSEDGQPARIAMKMNSLVDRRCIRALYRASQAGVPVDLNMRGICCLRPGRRRASRRTSASTRSSAASSSTRASTRSSAAATSTVYIGSADLMPRNLDTRVELLAPVEDAGAARRPARHARALLADDTNAWELAPTARGRGASPSTEEPRNVQRELMLGHAARAAEAQAASWTRRPSRRRRRARRGRVLVVALVAVASSGGRGTRRRRSVPRRASRI